MMVLEKLLPGAAATRRRGGGGGVLAIGLFVFG